MYVRYEITRPGLRTLSGIVGLVALDATELLPHEATTTPLIDARRSDVERAGALLEPILLLTERGERLRAVSYRDANGIRSKLLRGEVFSGRSRSPPRSRLCQL